MNERCRIRLIHIPVMGPGERCLLMFRPVGLKLDDSSSGDLKGAGGVAGIDDDASLLYNPAKKACV
jgi:hypothetical protein